MYTAFTNKYKPKISLFKKKKMHSLLYIKYNMLIIIVVIIIIMQI